MTPSARQARAGVDLTTEDVIWFVDLFVPRERRDDPAVSPLLADLCNLPPTLFSVGSFDPLLDDSLFMHGRWLAAGNQAQLAIWLHAFATVPGPLTDRTQAHQAAFLTLLLAQGPHQSTGFARYDDIAE